MLKTLEKSIISSHSTEKLVPSEYATRSNKHWLGRLRIWRQTAVVFYGRS